MDVGFWGGLVPGNSNNYSTLDGLLSSGALGFKSFMSPSGALQSFTHALDIRIRTQILAIFPAALAV